MSFASTPCTGRILTCRPHAIAGWLRRHGHAAGEHSADAGGGDAGAVPPAAAGLAAAAAAAAGGLGPAQGAQGVLGASGCGAPAGDDQPADHAGRIPRRQPPWRGHARPLHRAAARLSGHHHAAAGQPAAHALQRGHPAALPACAGERRRGAGGRLSLAAWATCAHAGCLLITLPCLTIPACLQDQYGAYRRVMAEQQLSPIRLSAFFRNTDDELRGIPSL